MEFDVLIVGGGPAFLFDREKTSVAGFDDDRGAAITPAVELTLHPNIRGPRYYRGGEYRCLPIQCSTSCLILWRRRRRVLG
jgi:hypothetical protein